MQLMHPGCIAALSLLIPTAHGVKVSAVAFDDNVARIDGLLVPFKKYFISDAAVEQIPRPAPSDLYRFFWVINSATMIKEVFEPETPTLPLFFDLTPFTSFQHFADSQISINTMGVVLHALPVKESRPEVPSIVSKDYVVVDQRARVKLDIADGTASISVIALGYEAEKLMGFTAYQLSQSEYEGVSLNLRVADTLDGKELLCYVKHSPEFIRVTGIRFTIVTSYLVGEASSVEK